MADSGGQNGVTSGKQILSKQLYALKLVDWKVFSWNTVFSAYTVYDPILGGEKYPKHFKRF